MGVIENLNFGSLTVNRACDNRCNWCYAQNTGFSSEVLSRKMAKELVRLMSDIKVEDIAIIGGEPTLYNDLFYVVELIHQEGMLSSMTTHGGRFSDKNYAKKIVDAGTKNITVSLKGIDREGYLQVTKRDGFNETCAGIKNLQERGLNPSLFITLGANEIDEVEKTLEFMCSLETSDVTISFANPVTMNGQGCNMNAPNPEQIAKAYTKIINKIDGMIDNVFVSLSIPLCLLSPKIRATAIARKSQTGTCFARIGGGIIFSPSGEVIPCHHFTDSTLGKYGVDFYDAETFAEFWRGGMCSEFRSMMNYYPSEDCQDCIDWGHCFGGCPIKWFYFNPKNFIKRR